MGFLKPKKKKKKNELENELKKGGKETKKVKGLREDSNKDKQEGKKKTKGKEQGNKKESNFKGLDRGQIVSEVWNTYARKWKLRRGWVTVTKSGRLVIVNPHMHQYPQGYKEGKKGRQLGGKTTPAGGAGSRETTPTQFTPVELLIDSKQKAKCRV